MEQFKKDILFHAIHLEKENDYLGYLIGLAKWSIAHKGTWINEKTPGNLKEDILEAIERVKKLGILLTELQQSGYSNNNSGESPDYDFYGRYFKKAIKDARNVMRKLSPYLNEGTTASTRFVLGEIGPGY